MAENTVHLCSPCEYNGKISNATNCCADCKELLCAECFVHHNSQRLSRNHHIITAEENKILEELKIPLTEYCDVHDQNKDLYCPSHDEVVCLTCSQTNHVKCQPSARLSDAAQNVKSSTFMSLLEEEIDELIKSLKGILGDREKQKKNCTTQKDEIMNTIKDIRSYINKKIDQLEEDILTELNCKYDKVMSEINKTSDILQCHEQELTDVAKKVTVLKSFASDTQTFIGIRALGEVVRQNNEQLTSFVGLIKDFSFQIAQNQNTFTTCSSMKSFGDIKVEIVDAECQLSTGKTLQGPSVRSSGVIQLVKKRTIKLQQETLSLFKSIILSCGIISDNQLVFLDAHARNRKLIIHGQDGTHVRTIDLPSKPFDITVIGNNKAALSFPWSTRKRVEIVSTIDFKTEHSIYFKNRCYGISYENGKLYVVVKTEGIIVMDLAGELFTSLPITGNGIYYVHVKSARLYCSDENNDTVQCYDTKGNIIWTYNNLDLKSPRAITTSDNGYIFIAGCKSNSVVALDMDGNFKEEICGVRCGLNSPTGLCFDPKENILIVCNSVNGQAVLYDMV